MLTAKLSCSPAATGRRSGPARRAAVVRASAGSYADELVSTAVRARIGTLRSNLWKFACVLCWFVAICGGDVFGWSLAAIRDGDCSVGFAVVGEMRICLYVPIELNLSSVYFFHLVLFI
jgi:hypothetical protein